MLYYKSLRQFALYKTETYFSFLNTNNFRQQRQDTSTWLKIHFIGRKFDNEIVGWLRQNEYWGRTGRVN